MDFDKVDDKGRRQSLKSASVRTASDESDFSGAVVTDGFNRAAFLGFLAKRFLLGAGWLFKNIGIPAVIVAGEIGRSGFPAEVTVDALVIDIVFPGHVFGVFVRDISHIP